MQDKNKWYIASSLSVIIIGICIIGFVSTGGNKDSKSSTIAIRSNTPALEPGEIRKHLEDAKNFDPPDPAENVKKAIASHQARIDANPDDPESPVLLEAMGNLYMLKLNDYEMAAYCYEQVLSRYPDADKTTAYIGLVTALEKKGDTEGVNRICREIRKEFPPESVEHQWAAEKTGRQLWEEPDASQPGSSEAKDSQNVSVEETPSEGEPIEEEVDLSNETEKSKENNK